MTLKTNLADRSTRPGLTLFGAVLLVALSFYVWQRPSVNAVSNTTDAGDDYASSVIASVNGETLTVESFVKTMGGYLGSPESATKIKHALIQEWVDFQVLLAQAKEHGYETDPVIRQAHERLMVNTFKEQQIRDRSDRVTVDGGEIAEFYAAHVAEFTTPVMVHAAMIEVVVPNHASDETRAEFLRRAKTARDEALSAAQPTIGFGEVASKYSDNQQTRYAGGDLGWMHSSGIDYKLHPKLQAAIFSMDEVGEVSDIVSTETGFYVLKLIEKRPAATRPLEEVKDQIKRRLTAENHRELVDRFMAETRREYVVKVNEDLLATVELGNRTAANVVPPMPAAFSKD